MSATATLRVTDRNKSTEATTPKATTRPRAKARAKRRTITKPPLPTKTPTPAVSTPPPPRPRRRRPAVAKRITDLPTSTSPPAESSATPLSPPTAPLESTADVPDMPASSLAPAVWAAKTLADRANRGSESALSSLRQLLATKPEIWENAGNICALAERALVSLIGAGDALIEESALLRARALKADLLGSTPTPLERLVIDWIAVSFLAVQQSECAAATPANGSIQQAAHRYRRAESAARRFATAIRTLAVVRRLLPGNVVSLAAKDSAGPATKVAAAPA